MPHVLIIEDDPLIALFLLELLEENGAGSCCVAVTEAEAVDAALQRRPDIITSDVRLLEGTGPNAVKRIFAKLGEIPVIFITGTPQDCSTWETSARIVGKPFKSAELVGVFRDLVVA